MNLSIKDYIENTYTPELQQIIFDTISLLDKLEVKSYEAFFLNELSELDNIDTEFAGTNFYNYFVGFLNILSREFGFTLVENITLENQTKIISGYVDLEYYIDHEAVIRNIEADATDNEKLSELISLTSDLTADTIITFIDRVDPAALMTLNRMHLLESNKEDLVNETESNLASDVQLKQIKAFKLFLGEREATIKAFELIRAGYDCGLKFKIYWNAVNEELLASNEINSLEFSRELLALMLISKEHWNNPAISFKNLSDQLWEDLTFISKINVAFRKVISEFDLFKVNNRI